MNDSTLEKYEYSYSLMTVMGSDGDIEYSTIIETDNPFSYYFRENNYQDTVDLVELHTGRIIIYSRESNIRNLFITCRRCSSITVSRN